MIIDGRSLTIQAVAKFHRTVYVSGSFSGADDNLKTASITGQSVIESVFQRDGATFTCQALLRERWSVPELKLKLLSVQGWKQVVPLDALARDGQLSSKLVGSFRDAVRKKPGAMLLDIGGRARSGIDRSLEYPSAKVTVLDVLPGENVDVVGDAHAMSTLFPPNSFDFVQSVSVFEHLVMPWKVALEMNRVMKSGALAFIFTHQTLGMHDMPWDFFRFSDQAWSGIFNPITGFEIVDRELSLLQFIVPFAWRPEMDLAEKAAGFEGSAVLVRKLADTALQWPVRTSDAVNTMYPA